MVETQEYGYDKSRFPKLMDESYDCIICSEVVRNPRECTGCGSLFCAPCISSWLTKTKECPNRCNPNTDSIKPIGKALLRMYNDLDVKCQYYDQCQQIVKLVDLEQHEKTCQLPKCGNFELCANFLKKEEKKEACSPECLLILKIKGANGNWKVVHNELQEFLSPYVSKVPVRQLSHAKSNSEITNTGSEGSVFTFKWDAKYCGANIKLTEDDTRAYLEEASYIFKTVLGTQGFTGGVHYWEIQADPKTENELKIGVSLKRDFDLKSAFCDFEYGYAYYGLGQLRHGSNANGTAYGKKFKKEGVLGVCLDMNKGTLSFSLNGEYFGVAYSGEPLKKGPIYPAIALLHNAGCKLLTGKAVPSYFPK